MKVTITQEIEVKGELVIQDSGHDGLDKIYVCPVGPRLVRVRMKHKDGTEIVRHCIGVAMEMEGENK